MDPTILQWSSDDIHYFQCKICKTGKIRLSNMGIGAVKSHMKGFLARQAMQT